MAYNIPDFVSRSEMNKVPISDFLAAANIPFYEQVMSLRHYSIERDGIDDNLEFTVNTARNEWISRNDNVHGQLTDLISYLRLTGRSFDGNYHDFMKFMVDSYMSLEGLPPSYPVTNLRMGRLKTMVTTRINDAVYAQMSLRGISKDVIDRYCKQVIVRDSNKSKDKHLLAFPADNDNWYVFRGTSWQPYDESSITTIGEFKKNQFCFVYESPLDFLSMMEKWNRNRVNLSFGSTYHLIINGRQNIRQAQQFIKDNPDFLAVKTFFPDTADGRQMFADIDDACKGTAVNRSDIFKGYASLSDQTRMRLPSDIYKAYVAPKPDKKKAESLTMSGSQSQTNGKASKQSRQTGQSLDSEGKKKGMSDKATKGTGPVREIEITPRRKWFGLR